MIIIILYLSITIFFLRYTPLLSAIEHKDFDKPFYTAQLQSIILGEKSELMYGDFRILSPLLSILLSEILGIDHTRSMFMLTLFSGMVSIIILWLYVKKNVQKNILLMLYIFSPPIMVYSITYFIEVGTYLFIFLIFILMKSYFTEKSDKKTFFILLSGIILGILNKEMVFLFTIFMSGFLILFHPKKIRDKKWKLTALIIIGALVVLMNYVLLFQFLKPNVINAYQFSEPITYRIHGMWNNIISLLTPANLGYNFIEYARSISFSFGAFWLLIIYSFFRMSELHKWETTYFFAIGLLMFIIMFPAPKYFFAVTFPYFLISTSEQLMKCKRIYINYILLSLLCVINILAIWLYSIILTGN
jgi:hypothetical protein